MVWGLGFMLLLPLGAELLLARTPLGASTGASWGWATLGDGAWCAAWGCPGAGR
jgi:hypothetical protein